MIFHGCDGNSRMKFDSMWIDGKNNIMYSILAERMAWYGTIMTNIKHPKGIHQKFKDNLTCVFMTFSHLSLLWIWICLWLPEFSRKFILLPNTANIFLNHKLSTIWNSIFRLNEFQRKGKEKEEVKGKLLLMKYKVEEGK